MAFAVSNVAKFSSNPTRKHWTALKRILRYLKSTRTLGFLYTKKKEDELVGYWDSDWADDVDDRRSTSGYMFMLSGVPISWRSRKQTSVALSTAKAEYVAFLSATQEALWLKKLTSELNNKPIAALVLRDDNQSAIAMAQNPQFYGRSKHIATNHHFVREQVSAGTVRLEYCPPEDMLPYMLTKGLSCSIFGKLREWAGFVPPPIYLSNK